jgi:hypothetical protein
MFRKSSNVFVCALALVLALPAAAASQDRARSASVPDLVTDRPDFTESSEVVGQGVLQVESGLTFEGDRQEGDRSRVVSAPQLLVRVGMTPRFELRLGGDGFVSESVRTSSGTVRTSGSSDAEIGLKYKLTGAPVAGFSAAVIPSLSLPTGHDTLTSDGYDPGVKLTWARELPRGFGLSGNVNVAWLTVDDQSRDWEPSLSLSLSHDLGESWGAYWETYGFLDGQGCACTFNTGVTRGFGRNLQLDVEVGRAMTAEAADWFVGVGFAIRRLGR